MSERRNTRVVVMDPLVPHHYRNAVRDILEVPMSEERSFIALTWSRRPLSHQSPIPTPLAWMISAENLQSAQNCSEAIRNILEAMLHEQMRDEIGPREFSAVKGMLHARVRLLSIREAYEILDDLGIPIYNNPAFHKVEDIVLVPFDEECGFTATHIEQYLGQIPNFNVALEEDHD